MKTPHLPMGRMAFLGVIILIISGSGCQLAEPVSAPERTALSPQASSNNKACIQTCAESAKARVAQENKRYGEAVALYRGDSAAIQAEQALHRSMLTEIRRELQECRRGCRSNK